MMKRIVKPKAGLGFCEVGPGSRGCITQFPPASSAQMIDAGRIFIGVFSSNTIVRTTGNWLGDGFEAGMTLKIVGSVSNDGSYSISDVTKDVLTIGGSLTSEERSDSTGVAITGEPPPLWSQAGNELLTPNIGSSFSITLPGNSATATAVANQDWHISFGGLVGNGILRIFQQTWGNTYNRRDINVWDVNILDGTFVTQPSITIPILADELSQTGTDGSSMHWGYSEGGTCLMIHKYYDLANQNLLTRVIELDINSNVIGQSGLIGSSLTNPRIIKKDGRIWLIGMSSGNSMYVYDYDWNLIEGGTSLVTGSGIITHVESTVDITGGDVYAAVKTTTGPPAQFKLIRQGVPFATTKTVTGPFSVGATVNTMSYPGVVVGDSILGSPNTTGGNRQHLKINGDGTVVVPSSPQWFRPGWSYWDGANNRVAMICGEDGASTSWRRIKVFTVEDP